MGKNIKILVYFTSLFNFNAWNGKYVRIYLLTAERDTLHFRQHPDVLALM